MSDEAYPDALPIGHQLHWYVLEHVLGQGGFGITYLARDTNLDRRVAIKEYLPTDYARRHADATVRARTESNAERYAWGLERFSLEARTLARFDHPSIVRVHSVFEANNTAYMVMRFEDGENLAHLLERCVTLPERQLVPCLLAILDGLQLVHDAGFIHRDIKPENIYVRDDGTPVLLDFGSARQSLGRSKTMTILVAPGYAPLEQYYGDSATQGPWTDIYGLGATCYRAIAGRAPLDAIARAKGVLGSARELLQPAVEVGRGRYDERLLAAIDRALRLSERDRPQNIAEWRREIMDPPMPAAASTDRVAPDMMLPPVPVPIDASAPKAGATVLKRPKSLMWGALAGAIALTVGVVWVPTVWRNAMAPEAPPPQFTRVPEAAPVAPIPVTPASSQVANEAPQNKMPPVQAPVVAPQDVVVASPARPKSDMTTSSTSTINSVRHQPAEPLRTSFKSGTSKSPDGKPVNIGSSPTPEVTDAGKSVAIPAPSLPLPLPSPAAVAMAPEAVQNLSRDQGTERRVRDEQLVAGEAALRRGDYTSAMEMLEPLALAGVPRSQTPLGRAYEGRGGSQASYFQAYVWYSIAAGRGESGAAALKDKVAGKLQPAEIVQADRVVERWKPSADSSAGSTR
jgi:serine/threonine protein kinase